MRFLTAFILGLEFAFLGISASAEERLKPILVGAAKVDVTPSVPVVLAGYGARTKPYEGIDTKLWARAMVIGDESPVAVVVIDNCGVPANVRRRLADRLAKNHGIPTERLVVAATHTHNAPTLVGYAKILWAGRTTPEQDKLTADYTTFAIGQMEAVVAAALEKRRPTHLEWGKGRATFGGNRRVLRDGKWAGFGFQRDQPVDHSLPVLVARDVETGNVRAVWANYACHCTTLGSRNHVGGDWAGFANQGMEKEFPHAVALMTIGCGADVGPQPSGSPKDAGQHGGSIAAEVRRLLGGETKKLNTAPSVASKRIQLPLERPRPRAHWEAQLEKGGFDRQLAKSMLAKLDSDGAIPAVVDYPVSAWKFGDDLAMVFLAGEVVVDYSVRLNRELDWSRLWLTAWANEMPGYIPSKRVLAEGGYEADFSQVYYDLPGRYQPEVEDLVVGAIHELVGPSYLARAEQERAPFHRLPGGDTIAFKRVAEWAATTKNGDEGKAIIRRLIQLSSKARSVGKVTRNDGEETGWHNYAGDYVQRLFIRQQKKGTQLTWKSLPMGKEVAGGERLVMCFTGGVGWESEPQTAGFGLFVGGEQKLSFDVTRKPAHWKSQDGKVELVYLPTWTSNVDSGGFFFLSLPVPPGSSGKDSISIGVRSLGEGSLRWFAIDSDQGEVVETLQKLFAALGGAN